MSLSHSKDYSTSKSKAFDSSLGWNIENFKEYCKQEIGSITSHKVPIVGTDVFWILHVHPNGYHSPLTYDDTFIAISIQIHCENPLLNHCFKVEVKTAGCSHQLKSPHDHDESEYSAKYTSECDSPLHKIKPIVWNIEYENVNKRHHLELFNEDFIKAHDLAALLIDGTLRLEANVSTKFV